MYVFVLNYTLVRSEEVIVCEVYENHLLSLIETVSCTVQGVGRVMKLGLKVLAFGQILLLEIQSPGNASELVPSRSLNILAMNGGKPKLYTRMLRYSWSGKQALAWIIKL